MFRLAVLALPALSSAAILPRAEPSNLLPTPYHEASARRPSIPEPVHITWTEADVFAKGGNATAAPAQEPDEAVHLAALQARGIIGADDRVVLTDTIYPFSAMGRLRVNFPGGASSWCSASLVGPRVVATARHCVSPGASYSFSPAYLDRDRLPTGNVVSIISLRQNGELQGCEWRNDWALMILDRSLAASSGFFGARPWDNSVARQSIFRTYGYPQDRNPTGQQPYVQGTFPAWVEGGCDNGGPVFFTADVTPGQSGSPIYRQVPVAPGGEFVQYGIAAAGSDNYNLWAHGEAFVNAVTAARRDFPA
ncbi:hypothetical protein PpBr36_04796 [Pyricularia pennisetigena]|uniref:hypothetical protein n=1 Tax=Pyricularia pennisetigena TaxID=1578925 RepID=UPI00114F4338|nr:hypothetical protein PpBr36_04796 [Pyricularia pennisetigena]TLS26871.1 hypothetical protein PpBr36_04796 [Pyricularia pennisetigena]